MQVTLLISLFILLPWTTASAASTTRATTTTTKSASPWKDKVKRAKDNPRKYGLLDMILDHEVNRDLHLPPSITDKKNTPDSVLKEHLDRYRASRTGELLDLSLSVLQAQAEDYRDQLVDSWSFSPAASEKLKSFSLRQLLVLQQSDWSSLRAVKRALGFLLDEELLSELESKIIRTRLEGEICALHRKLFKVDFNLPADLSLDNCIRIRNCLREGKNVKNLAAKLEQIIKGQVQDDVTADYQQLRLQAAGDGYPTNFWAFAVASMLAILFSVFLSWRDIKLRDRVDL